MSNPFRKKVPQEDRTPSPSKPSLRITSGGNSPLPDDRFSSTDALPAGAPKPVKKRVRVLSPPPQSPERPLDDGVAAALGAAVADHDAAGHGLGRDPFLGAYSTDDSDAESIATSRPTSAAVGGLAATPTAPAASASAPSGPAGPQVNPFSKTLHDLESPMDPELGKQQRDEGEALKAANAAARQSLDVDAFHRLLMTGKVDDQPPSTQHGPPTKTNIGTGDRPWNPPDSSDDDEEAEFEARLGSSSNPPSPNPPSPSKTRNEKKAPPPPPSSRHGKSLRDSDRVPAPDAGVSVHRLIPPTNLNKPLPVSPARTSVEEGSPFDRESVGRVPEPRPVDVDAHATPGTPRRSSSTGSSSGKKNAPAPPPRRTHGRSDTRGQGPGPAATPPSPEQRHQTPMKTAGGPDETPAPESTEEALSSRPSTHVPAPPPPRRPHPAAKQAHHAAPQSTPPSSPPTAYPASPDLTRRSFDSVVTHQAGNTKSSPPPPPPPPPPSRNTSIRRPPSVRSVEGLRRHVSVESKRPARDGVPPPPPPPRRDRVNSSESRAEGRERAMSVAAGQDEGVDDAGQGTDILADLNALRREVDALRDRFRG
ncbi:hypothetical protein DCS_04194 [Drechmeria coniospora]|uniref:Uncharacterized protein n=1 Tax=Drechmeria coniospora TaxID=98403 RepID=A0A151GJB5_DRECN|nr:hypothetical protein DCS_04194 [Drechmeria coniospora]KYK57187.1 hypothetical protein DCS_04194 [Drechmeria coniospora]